MTPLRVPDYTTVTAVNLRKYLPHYNLVQHACQAYVANIVRTVYRDEKILTFATELSNNFLIMPVT